MTHLQEVWTTTCNATLENKETQIMVNDRDLDTNRQQKAREGQDQPGIEWRREARDESTLLVDEPTSEKKCEKRQEKLHWGSY